MSGLRWTQRNQEDDERRGKEKTITATLTLAVFSRTEGLEEVEDENDDDSQRKVCSDSSIFFSMPQLFGPQRYLQLTIHQFYDPNLAAFYPLRAHVLWLTRVSSCKACILIFRGGR